MSGVKGYAEAHAVMDENGPQPFRTGSMNVAAIDQQFTESRKVVGMSDSEFLVKRIKSLFLLGLTNG